MSVVDLKREMRRLADPGKAKALSWFFKTGPGEYGEGDKFLGIIIPKLRKIAGQFESLSLPEIRILLQSPIHEERSLALMILVSRFKKGDEEEKKRCFDFYLRNLGAINNWDLVDGSAPYITGPYLENRNKAILFRWARSKNLWERRIAIISTGHFIRQRKFKETLRISAMLLADGEDLIHKAVGWMLREVGKRDMPIEEKFLKRHYRSMPRTMLRYAIERFPERKRLAYLKGRV